MPRRNENGGPRWQGMSRHKPPTCVIVERHPTKRKRAPVIDDEPATREKQRTVTRPFAEADAAGERGEDEVGASLRPRALALLAKIERKVNGMTNEFYDAFSGAAAEVTRRNGADRGPTVAERRDARLRAEIAADSSGGSTGASASYRRE